MKKYLFLSLAVISAGIMIAGLTITESCVKTDQKPNILFIMSDDHAYQAISAYGGMLSEFAPTPNIDRIANEGMRFDRCMVTNSICGPSRATILTGKYSHLNGFRDNSNKMFDGSQLTFPKLFQQAGYKTAMIGKWHLNSDPTGFDHWDILPGQGSYYNPVFIDTSGRYNMTGYTTEIITDKALQWLTEVKDSGKPFMLMMHHKAPHRSWEPGPNELGMFDSVTFPEPATLFDDYSNRGTAERSQDMTIAESMTLEGDLKLVKKTPQAEEEQGRQRPRWGRHLTPEQLEAWNAVYDPKIEHFYASDLSGDDLVRYKYQRYMQDYLACIAAVDKSVGKVLDFLKSNGMDKNTILVYTSDQGFYLGEHGWFDKRWMFEESLRTPLFVMWPGVVQPGSVNGDMVSNLDFAETFLDAANIKIPEEMQGRSFLLLLKGNTPGDWRTAHYYHYYEYPGWHSVKRHYGITTDRYKLIHFYYDIDEWELFDLKNNPNEMKNVYNDPAYSDVKETLHEQLDQLSAKYIDSDSLTRSFLPETAGKQ